MSVSSISQPPWHGLLAQTTPMKYCVPATRFAFIATVREAVQQSAVSLAVNFLLWATTLPGRPPTEL